MKILLCCCLLPHNSHFQNVKKSLLVNWPMAERLVIILETEKKADGCQHPHSENLVVGVAVVIYSTIEK